MEKSSSISLIESRITLLKEKLDGLVDEEQMNSGKVLEISRELDTLILGYYTLRGGLSSR